MPNVIHTTKPRLVFSKERGDSFDLSASPDVFCPHCNAGCMMGVEWGEDHPPDNTSIPTVCWSCGTAFNVYWCLEPVWYKGRAY